MECTDGKKVRALGLCSGGLDSILSALVLKKQGIEVSWVVFETPFFSSEKARKASFMTGIPLKVEKITPVYLKMLRNPPCGYGAHMNPCLDCHALMLKLAGGIMEKEGFHFLFTGEVLGQRPMSQSKGSLRYVEKTSGFEGYILRPLSAKLLPPTIIETKGLIDREKLLDLKGRTRKPQMKLAEEMGISEYPSPAGGCLLTDPGYSRRLRDLFQHQQECMERDLELLKFGRHFRLDQRSKVIVGRTRADNEKILDLADQETDIIIKLLEFPGPLVLIPYRGTSDMVRQAAILCASYSKAHHGRCVKVSVRGPGCSETIEVTGTPVETFREYLV
nr:DUF814 domain-containing protein [Desulfobacterales bacterium]